MTGLRFPSLNEYCVFDENTCYVLMAISRKKENEEITTNSEIVFREVLKNGRDPDRKLQRLRAQAEHYEADEGPLTWRFYLTVNARDVLSANYNFRDRLNDQLKHLHYGDEDLKERLKRTNRNFISELQRPHNRAEKNFMFDLDDIGEVEMERFAAALPKQILAEAETPNGYHLVTEPFNYTEWDEPFEYELKNDGLMLVDYLQQ